MKVILISGKARHGKDTAAQFLQDELVSKNKKVLITHYADLLKYICRNFFGWDGKKDNHGRELLQYIGTDVVRKKAPDLWVNFIIQMLELFGESWDYVIIPDCRFPNEILKVKEAGFETIHMRIVRPGFESGLSEEQMNHASEIALDNTLADYYIENVGDLDAFRKYITKWTKETLYEDYN